VLSRWSVNDAKSNSQIEFHIETKASVIGEHSTHCLATRRSELLTFSLWADAKKIANYMRVQQVFDTGVHL
jgi:hypothetical protein